jgi:predicted nuclease of predicted toxin-antitoxin system
VKFIIDAQITYRLAIKMQKIGFDAIHTDDLPQKEFTTDQEIINIAQLHSRIVITKDADFVNAFYVQKKPSKLLFLSVGNLKNDLLFKLFFDNIHTICLMFQNNRFIELTNTQIIVHI